MILYIISTTCGKYKHEFRGRSIKEAQNWRDKNLCSFQNWNIQPVFKRRKEEVIK